MAPPPTLAMQNMWPSADPRDDVLMKGTLNPHDLSSPAHRALSSRRPKDQNNWGVGLGTGFGAHHMIPKH